MNITKIGIGEYRNVASASDLAEICDDVSRLIEYFRTDIFHDFAAMREVLYQCEPTRRIWSARKCGTHYIDVKDYNNYFAADDNPIIQFLVESNADGEMTFTRIR